MWFYRVEVVVSRTMMSNPLAYPELRPASGAKSNLSRCETTTDNMAKLEQTNSGEVVTYLFPDCHLLNNIYSKEEFRFVDITGFEIYIVEQWACERKYCNVITVFTGDSEHKVQCAQVTLPKDRSTWSEKILHFFKEVELNGGSLKETEKGLVFITNLSSVPSNLNLVPVSNGCVMDVWECFKVNVNMKRMNCGGRSALLLCSPSDACEDKFRQVYKTHPTVDIMYSVRELVMLLQICLVDFKLLDPVFVDGLLCNKTEENITKWWVTYGALYYGVQPKERTLGPMTVSAILGFVLSCHYRFDMASIDFPKEPFNYFSFRVIVGKFQKQYNLQRTWYLDPATVEKLFKVTSKTSASDISKLKNVVKSRVHDISGKTSSERIAQDVLTTDLERAIRYFHCSPRLEYLWFGKGNPMDLKQFEYYERIQAQMTTASALKSGVGKIRNFPKRLQVDDYMIRRKGYKGSSDYKSSESASVDNLCQVLDETKHKENVSKRVICDDDVCKKELKRRSSYPFIREELTVEQLGYANHSTNLDDRQWEEKLLRRCKSTSFISDSVLPWCTTVSPIFVAHQLKRLEWKLLYSKECAEAVDSQRKEYHEQWERCHSKLTRVGHFAKPVFNKCESQVNNDQRLHLGINDIRALGSRLEYEMRLLGTRVRDAQESVNGFELKIKQFKDAIRMEEYGQIVDPNDNNSSALEDRNNGYWHYRFDVQRVKRIWGIIEQFTPVKWLTGASLDPKGEQKEE